MILKGKAVPDWLKNWADYEKLPGYEKAYKNLHFLSRLLLIREEKKLTPKEFIERIEQEF